MPVSHVGISINYGDMQLGTEWFHELGYTKTSALDSFRFFWGTPHQHCWFHTCFICRHSIYYGDAQLATEWFHKLGYTIPYLINAADFILDLASGDVSTKKISGADSRLHLINCAERFLTVSAVAANRSGSCGLAHDLLVSYRCCQMVQSQKAAFDCCSIHAVKSCMMAYQSPGYTGRYSGLYSLDPRGSHWTLGKLTEP